MDKQITCFFFGVQLLAVVSVFLVSVFFVGFSGGLDLVGYDFPGLREILYMFPVVFLFTILIYVIYPRLKKQTLASILLVIALISNAVLAIQVIRILSELVNWFV